jgi:hypothetical protein
MLLLEGWVPVESWQPQHFLFSAEIPLEFIALEFRFLWTALVPDMAELLILFAADRPVSWQERQSGPEVPGSRLWE